MITNLKPYPAYKDSGVPWLGQVPEHWKVRRIKNAARVIMGQSPSSNDCSVERIGLPFLQGCAEFGVEYPQPKQFCKAPSKVSPAGAILMSVRAPVGRLNMADQEYGIGRGLCAIVPQPGLHHSRFIRFGVIVCLDGLAVLSTGSTYDAVSVTDVAGLRIPLPPLPEQTAIVRFLDWADRRIRRVIRLRERRIKLLEEYKQALINQAVAGKIDVRTGKPYPAYKDSGVPWLGEVPKHWEVRRLGTIVEMRVSNVDKHSKEGEEPVRLCNYVDVYKHERIRANMEFMKVTASKEEIVRFRLEQGDVLITKDSEAWNDIGVPALVESSAPDLISGYHLALLRPRQVVEGAFLLRALQNPQVAYQFHVEAKGVTRYGLSQNAIKSVSVPLPLLPEQTAIVEYLDAQTERIDAAIAASRREMDLLKEFRTRLIADVVTGKLDVREAAARLPDEPPGEETASLDGEDSAADGKADLEVSEEVEI